MRIRRQAFAVDFLTEVVQLVGAEAAFHKGTGVNAGCAVALYKYQIAFFITVFGTPEVVEAHIVKGGGRLERGDMAAELQIFFTGTQHHGGGIPADNRTDAMLQLVIAG